MVAHSLPAHAAPRLGAAAAARALVRACRRAHAAYTERMRAPVPDPYAGLHRALLAHAGGELTITFDELERLLGAPLPDDAWRRVWWANTPRVAHAQAWLAAGFRVHWVRRRGDTAAVTFARSG